MPVKEPVRALPAGPPAISLLSSAEDLTEPSGRWEGGVSYEPEACGLDNTGALDPCNIGSVDVALGNGSISIEPFAIWGGDSCSSFGFGQRDWKGRATRKLLACESALIASELWRGTIARSSGWDNPYLTKLGSTSITTASVEPITALACLEQALGNCNCGTQGMIHATRELVTYWASLSLIRREGSRLLTTMDTVVVPDAGYDGSGPQTIADGDPVVPSTGSIWAYATSMVHFRLGPIEVVPATQSEAMDPRQNIITYRAQRIVEVGFDCCHFAAEVDLPGCQMGS